MPRCIKESEYNPDIHVIVGGPYTLEECQFNCGSVSLMKSKDCGCGKKLDAHDGPAGGFDLGHAE